MFKLSELLCDREHSDDVKRGLQNVIGRTQAFSTMSAREFQFYQMELEVLLKHTDLKNKYEGFTFLIKVVGICSNEIFNNHSDSWIRNVVSHLGSDFISLRNQAFFAIKCIMERKKKSELIGDIRRSIMPQILGEVLKTEEKPLIPVQCLLATIEKMTSLEEPQIEQILKFLNLHFGSVNPQEIEVVSNCVAYLPKLHASNFKEFWKCQFCKVANSLFDILAQFRLYGDVGRDEEYVGPRFNIPHSRNTLTMDLSYAIQLHAYFRSICQCGIKMLNLHEPVILPIGKLLNLIHDALCAVSAIMLSKSGHQDGAVTLTLPEIWKDVVQLFEALIGHCCNYFMTRRKTTYELITVALTASESICARSKNDFHPRSRLYRVFNALTTKIQTGIFEKETLLLMPLMLKDACLDFNPTQTNPVIFARDRGSGTGSLSIPTESTTYKEIIRGNCLEALRALTSVMYKQENMCYEDLGVKVGMLLFFIQKREVAPAPYDDDDCRKELYHLYMSLISHAHLSKPQHINKATVIFHAGLSDASLSINQLCNCALQFCRFIPFKVQPAMPKAVAMDFTEVLVPEKDEVPKKESLFEAAEVCVPPLEREITPPGNDIEANSAIRTNEDNVAFVQEGAEVGPLEQPGDISESVGEDYEEMDGVIEADDEERGDVTTRPEDEEMNDDAIGPDDEDIYEDATGPEDEEEIGNATGLEDEEEDGITDDNANSDVMSGDDDQREELEESIDYGVSEIDEEEEEGEVSEDSEQEIHSANFNSTSVKLDSQTQNSNHCVENDRLQNGATSSLSREDEVEGESELHANDIHGKNAAIHSLPDAQDEIEEERVTKKMKLDIEPDDMVTGEENEVTLFTSQAKSFRSTDGEREIVELQILRDASEKKIKLCMSDKSSKECSYYYPSKGMEIEQKGDKSFLWFAKNILEKGSYPEQFGLTFKTAELAQQFYSTLMSDDEDDVVNADGETETATLYSSSTIAKKGTPSAMEQHFMMCRKPRFEDQNAMGDIENHDAARPTEIVKFLDGFEKKEGGMLPENS